MSEMTTECAVDPVVAFRARCEARAILYGAGELDLHDAVDELQAHAERHGLVSRIGQDAAQAIMADAFRPVREREWENATTVANPADMPMGINPENSPMGENPAVVPIGINPENTTTAVNPNSTPASTIEALMYALRRGMSCLSDPVNRNRLWCCDEKAMREISTRLLNLKARSKGARENWSAANVAKLASMWTAGHTP